MTQEDAAILDLGQQIYLAKSGKRRDLSSDETAAFIDDTIDWVNQFLPELELEADWIFARQNNTTLGSASTTAVYPLDAAIRKLVVSPYRDLSIQFDGQIVSTFRMVNPNQIVNPADTYTGDRATIVGRNLVLSRIPTEQEQSGDIVGDIINYLPRLSHDDISLLSTVDPLQLIVLGVMKNQMLPDIVKGVLTPSATQKYTDLLSKCVEQNNATADGNIADRENLGFVRGVW